MTRRRKTLLVCVVVALLSGLAVAPVAGASDERLPAANAQTSTVEPGESFDDAPVIDEGTYSNLSIEDGESHYFAVELDAGEELTTNIYFSHDDGDLDLAVHGPDETELESSTSVSDDEEVTITAEETGTYYIRPYGFSGASADYDLEVDIAADEQNGSVEPGESFDDAPVIDEGTYSGYSIDEGESHYFAVELDAGEELTTNIYFSHDDGDLDLAVHGPDETEIGSSASVSDDEEVTITAEEAGTYYIRPYGFSGASADYDLEVDIAADEEPGEIPPGDSFDDAPAIDEGTYSGYSIDEGESHYFAVELDAGEELTTNIYFSHDDGDLDLAVHGPDQTELESSASVSDDEEVTITAEEAGTYYIRPYGFSGASADYDLEVRLDAATDTESEGPGYERGFGSAPAIDEGTYSDLAIENGESHYFAVELDAGEELTAGIDFSHDDGDLDLAVHGPDETELESSTSVSDDEEVTITAEEAGTYYIRPYGFSGASADYDLEVRLDADADTEGPGYERGFESAPVIEAGTYSDLAIENGESHYFAVELDAGEQLTAGIDFSHDDGDLDLAVHGPDETELESSASVSDDEEVTITAEEAGTYYIRPYGYSGASADYGLTVRLDADADTEGPGYERGFEGAPVIEEGTYSDLAIEDGESHYFAVELDAGEQLTAEIDFSHADGDLDLAVHAPDRNELESSASTTDGEEVTITAEEAGTYYVRPYGYSGASAEYDLEVRLDAEAEGPAYERGFEGAPTIDEGTYSDLSIEDGESHHFAVELDAGEQLTAEIDFSHADGDLDLAVHAPDRDELESSTSTTDGEEVTITAEEAGTYYIRPYGYSGASADYDLTVSVASSDAGATPEDAGAAPAPASTQTCPDWVLTPVCRLIEALVTAVSALSIGLATVLSR